MSNESSRFNTPGPTAGDHPITVLLVDDQAIVAEAVKRMLLSESDITLHYCGNPSQAIRIATEVEPTVILQDLVMPDVDGLLLLRFFRANEATCNIPMIVLSSKEDPRLKADAFAMGANDYLVKLPDKVELIARIRYHSKAYVTLLQRNEAYQAMQIYLEQLEVEQAKSERLLLNILPKAIAEQLKKDEGIIAESFAEVSVLFADMVNFTDLSARISAAETVHLLNEVFSRFDNLAERHHLEKIKTIGDAYMVVAGVPVAMENHAEALAEMALDMHTEMIEYAAQSPHAPQIRIGISSGPVIAGIIGRKKFIYDLWGDTVNMASRMESHGVVDAIQVTEGTYERISDKYDLESRGMIQVKGRGEMMTYLLKGRKPCLSASGDE